MVELKKNMKRCFGYDCDRMMVNIVLRKNLWKLLYGYKFTKLNNKYIFDENGEFTVSPIGFFVLRLTSIRLPNFNHVRPQSGADHPCATNTEKIK